MCGRYTLHHSQETLSAHFGVSFEGITPRYNVAPTERVRFIFSNTDERRQGGVARWGFVPLWSKTGTTETPLFNARAEKVLQKPAFRNAFIRGRCLIPTSSWYEWARSEQGKKQPYHLRLERAENRHVAAEEQGGELVFYHQVLPGPASRSYGIEVAQLAGMPQQVVERAKEVLASLEGHNKDA